MPVGTVTWDEEWSSAYDESYAHLATPAVVDPMVDLLFEEARGGPVLEFAVGTGRIALPLQARGVEVTGIELSPHMVDQLRGKPGAEAIDVTIGDMATTRVEGSFALVYLVANSLMNVTTQEEQCAVVANAAAHLAPGGAFVIELAVPQLQRVPVGETHRVFALQQDHVGIESYEDQVGQVAWSHHWFHVGGRLVRHSAPYRYVWPAELDLMARLAGLARRDRWVSWTKDPFTSRSPVHVSVYVKPE
jgi:ubiquinone/menaquinone biosynthesis C-methylase UbiE